jgi:transposase-like protein
MYPSAIQSAIKRGHIARGPDGLIDSDQADVWRTQIRRAQGQKPIESETRATTVATAVELTEQLARAKASREIYAAKKVELEYRREAGELIECAKTEAWLLALLTLLKQELQAIGTELQDDLVGLTAPEIGLLIQNRINRSLAHVSRQRLPAVRTVADLEGLVEAA